MNREEAIAKKFMPLTEATFCILAALAEPGHGYGIMQRVETATHGRIHLGPGTLYGALTKMLEQKLIVRSGESGNDNERRKLYALTDLGRQVAKLECLRLKEMVEVGHRLLQMKGGEYERYQRN